MDKLITTENGGYPFELDDIRWMDEGVRTAIIGLCTAFGDNFILQGCVPTNTGGSLYDITAGWVVLDGEPFYYPGVTGQTILDAPNAYFTDAITFDATGFETFEDVTTHNTYQKRRAQVVQAPPIPTPGVKLYEGARLADQLLTRLSEATGGWTLFGGLSNGWVTSGVSTYPAAFRLEAGGLLRLRGWLDGSGSSGPVVIVLPSQCWPAKDVFGGLLSGVSALRTAIFQLTPAGALNVTLAGAAGVSDKYDLSQVPAISLH